MVLPVGVAKLGEFKGDKGRPGTFDSATAESVPAGEPAEAIISGTEGEHVHFKIPRGLSGTNGDTADAAVGGYVGATDSATSAALHARFPVFRVWDGSAYPSRIPGAFNVFFGPEDPGLVMDAGDFWANSNATTLDTVASQIGLAGTAVRAAVVDAATSESIYLSTSELGVQNNETSIIATILGSTPNRRRALIMPAGAVSYVYGGLRLPAGWTQIKQRVHWQHSITSPGTGNVQWVAQCTASPFTGGVSSSMVSPVGNRDIDTIAETAVQTVPADRYLHIGVARNGAATTDTFANAIQLLGVEIVRVA